MKRPQKASGSPRVTPAEQSIRDQEVLRATRELAAYFKGQRTEREARAALKIIKAFVRDRERLDPKDRPALPGPRPPVETRKRPRRVTRQKSRTKRTATTAEHHEPAAEDLADTTESPTDR